MRHLFFLCGLCINIMLSSTVTLCTCVAFSLSFLLIKLPNWKNFCHNGQIYHSKVQNHIIIFKKLKLLYFVLELYVVKLVRTYSRMLYAIVLSDAPHLSSNSELDKEKININCKSKFTISCIFFYALASSFIYVRNSDYKFMYLTWFF